MLKPRLSECTQEIGKLILSAVFTKSLGFNSETSQLCTTIYNDFWIRTCLVIDQECFRCTIPHCLVEKKNAHLKIKFGFSVGKFKKQKVSLCRWMDYEGVFSSIFFRLHLPLLRSLRLTLPRF